MIQAIEVYDLVLSQWSGDEYESPREGVIQTFTRRYCAEEELDFLKRKEPKESKESESLRKIYSIRSRLVRPEEAKVSKRPDNFKHIEDVTPIDDECGQIRETYSSEKLSVAYVNLSGKAKRHQHKLMEEVYFVTRGEGFLTIGEERYKIERGDCVGIPKGQQHFLEVEKGNLEVLVITHPKFSREDVILEG